MSSEPIDAVIRNIDRRLSRVEQILPALATREELQAAIAPLATRAELQAAIAPLVTREELAAAIAPLATREELHAAIAAAIAPLATREELRAEGERARRHATVLFEDLKDDNRLILEHLLALSARVDELARR
jgi:hypothetical protein